MKDFRDLFYDYSQGDRSSNNPYTHLFKMHERAIEIIDGDIPRPETMDKKEIRKIRSHFDYYHIPFFLNTKIDKLVDLDVKAAYFYILYYFVYVKGLMEYEGKLKTFANQLSELFFEYGIISTRGELNDMYSVFTFPESFSEFFTGLIKRTATDYDFMITRTRFSFSNIIDDWEFIYKQDISNEKRTDMIKLIINNLFVSYPDLQDIDKAIMFESIFDVILYQNHYFDADHPYYDHILNFADHYPRRYFESASRIFLTHRWAMDYGGKRWSNICNAMLKRDSESSIKFIDRAWNIQHNTDNWFNRIMTAEESASLKWVLNMNFEGEYDKLINYVNKDMPELSLKEEYTRRESSSKYETFRSLLIPVLFIGGIAYIKNKGSGK